MLTRIISGVIGIALSTFIIQTGGLVFGAAVLVLMCVGWHEYSQAFRNMDTEPAYLTGFAAMAAFWACGWLNSADKMVAAALAATLCVLMQAVFRHGKFNVGQACVSVTGVMYVGLPFTHLLLLRFWGDGSTIETSFGTMETGCAWLWIALVGTWASDSFAYFAGRAFGKTKLCEKVSPKKTVEGFIGGAIGTAASVAALGSAFNFPMLPLAILGASLAAVATIGDLVESILKRYTGIKDSGILIPGHGGVLDRFDSVLFTVPFVYYFIQLL